MNLKLKNSVYGNGSSLRVEGGRLVNDQPSSEMGLVQMANARRNMKQERKVQMQAEAYFRGEQMSELNRSLNKF